MNYIRHLTQAFKVMDEDNRIKAFHITLYMAFFRQWNINRFQNPIFFNRIDIMKAARMGSLTTYTKCLRELHEWEYLKYIPHHNPVVQSAVHMYSLCTIECTTGRTLDVQQSVQQNVQPLYINNNKHNKLFIKDENTNRQKEIRSFFKENNWNELDADKFFLHYETCGWITGNNIPVTDWQAAAQKWILNKPEINSYGTNKNTKQQSAGKLQATTNKNYSEPL